MDRVTRRYCSISRVDSSHFGHILIMNVEVHKDLARTLGTLAIHLQDQTDSASTLSAIVAGAVAIVPGAHGAGISLIEGRTVTAQAPSSPTVAELETLQTTLDEGPCLSALREHRTVLIEDTKSDTRWPRFATAAADLGVRSLLSFQLFVESHNLGALNLYGEEPHAFTEESRIFGELVAQHASVAMVGAAASTQFRDALSSRDIIGQAKGILMHRENLSGVGAFELLVKTSQSANIKLIELARWLVEEHEAGLGR